eukprot:gene24241-biopygen5899
MGPEVGPAFQRRSRDTPSSNIDARLAETVSRHRPGSKEQETWEGPLETGPPRARAPGAQMIRLASGTTM